MKLQKITPFLWYNTQALQAAKFYTSIFPRSKITRVTRYGKIGPGPKGSVMTVAFELNGQAFAALNGGPDYRFTHAISFVVNCTTQAEVDRYWKRLSSGGKEVQCGWLVDKFGVSWQITPAVLLKLIADPDEAKSQRVMAAMMKMVKLDIAGLKRAAKAG